MFAPYLASAGGGERVMVAIADRLRSTYDVVLAAPRLPDETRWRDRGFPDVSVEVMDARAVCRASIGADLHIAQANHVPLPSFARRRVLVVQFPFDDIGAMSRPRRLAARAALHRWSVVTYSAFGQRHLAERWGVMSAELLPPPVVPVSSAPGDKNRTIVSVARFVSVGHAKRQDVLLDAWERVADALPDWSLRLIGGGSTGDPYVESILARAASLPRVSVSLDLPAEELAAAYRGADLFWHATGFGRPDDAPDRAEHFGITPVEAMSAGAVPLVYADGGPADVVESTTGVAWRTVDDLVAATIDLAGDEDRRRRMQHAGTVAARRFSPEAFDRRLDEIVAATGATAHRA